MHLPLIVIKGIANSIDIPIIVTVGSDKTDIQKRLDAGVSILTFRCFENCR